MERPIDIQLDKLKRRLIKMSSIVDEQVDNAINCVVNWDLELVKEVENSDKIVDTLDVKNERNCHKIFALNQPVAMDLRVITSALKINSNLERIGDIAVKIVEFCSELTSLPDFYQNLRFPEVADYTRKMIKYSIDAFIGNDHKIARDVLEMENQLDKRIKNEVQLIKEFMEFEKSNIAPGLIFYSIYNELEHLGNHAVNISEEVYFIVKAQSLKHQTLD
ncbi:MAG: phosphate signaling complex protein PhoU [Melioribacteraceae bacterium]|nr:phosphate signaling complex protein PhoU [Melioribacteraceae bacterium]MCF8263255.1 phosphate signaling complex protein PhoU [Melioribacteraceae bacterium]MCF8412874.1 phosphate signaling complex protein PhoU [Melioribacteraceae bacterium]MCF8430695.1 phosphate signaling complex protein PhoU [Melioribacteraceae bacterium]